MPHGDRTGPWGNGPRTGRAAGFCSGFPVPGYANSGQPAERFVAGRGGHGHRHWFYATGLTRWQRWQGANPFPPIVDPEAREDELESLSRRIDDCQGWIAAVWQRIEELKTTRNEPEGS
jgi:hypothetical protein